MKRTILPAVLCMVCTIGLFAQKEKAVRIHKTDGTVVEYHAAAIRDFSFSGKAIVNDDDYTQITDLALVIEDTKINIDITATFSADDPNITGIHYGTDWGILYSTSPDVTVENGTLLEGYYESDCPLLQGTQSNYNESILSSAETRYRIGESVTVDEEFSGKGGYADLDYNTTYYFRTFVYRPENNGIYDEEYFYSKEHSISTGKPSMEYYDIALRDFPSQFIETGYVLPTEEAWATFETQYPYFTAARRDTLLRYWDEYLTPRFNTFKAQCNTVYECLEGTIYMLDNIGEEFCQYLLTHYEGEYAMQGYTDTFEGGLRTYVECDASWDVPDNGYWKYYSDTGRDNPIVEFPLTKHVLAGYNYRVEVTLAPNTEQTDTLPSKIHITMQCPANEFYATEDFVLTEETYAVSSHECSTLVFDSIEPKGFGEAKLTIRSELTSREIKTYQQYIKDPEKYSDRTVYAPVLRIARIKVTPYKK